MRRLARDGKDWIARYQAQEITRTGIASLKVGFTDVMGYYIEITNANEARVPADYFHERTLKNAKRFSTPRLKEYEEKVVTAQERSQALECELFCKLRDAVADQTPRLVRTADALAQLDFLAGLAEVATSRNYVRPEIVDEPILLVEASRHPVLDATLPAGTVVPNDVRFHPAEGVFWLVTGPNMSGKSTFIRQVALVTILAQMGSFVPAKSATVGVTDRVFTRVGASDELSRGQSTFMVEMTEAANILNNATSRSLVILDEIGRGTSTYDGRVAGVGDHRAFARRGGVPGAVCDALPRVVPTGADAAAAAELHGARRGGGGRRGVFAQYRARVRGEEFRHSCGEVGGAAGVGGGAGERGAGDAGTAAAARGRAGGGERGAADRGRAGAAEAGYH